MNFDRDDLSAYSSTEMHPSQTRWLRALAPTAICLIVAICVIAFVRNTSNTIALTQFNASSLLDSSLAARSEGELPSLEAFGEQYSLDFAQILPGWIVESGKIEPLLVDGTISGTIAVLYYTKNRTTLRLLISTSVLDATKPLLLSTPRKIGGRNIYLGEDLDSGTFYAVWQDDNPYFCLSSESLSPGSLVELLADTLPPHPQGDGLSLQDAHGAG